MSVYKVPQDVEAEDKLIGPFGFRQFIYLLIVAFFSFVAFLLAKIFIGLILIPAPIIIFFLAIALPLRKDQPTEVYLAAVLQYYLKPKKRLWQPDGVLSTVTITAPKTVEVSRIKDLSEDEAIDRLGQLAQIMDTHGWAARGVFNPAVNSTGNVQLSDAVVQEAAEAKDILDPLAQNAQSFDQLITQQKALSRQSATMRMGEAGLEGQRQLKKLNAAPPTQVSAVTLTPSGATPMPQTETDEDRAALAQAGFNPYPTAIHQHVIQPLSAKTKAKAQPQATLKVSNNDDDATAKSTSDLPITPDIIDLAHNTYFSIATIAEQAHRQAEKRGEEVEIKLH